MHTHFFGISNVKVSTLLIFITLFFIFFYGFKNFFSLVSLKNIQIFLSTYEAYLQSTLLYTGYFKKSVSYFKKKILLILL